MTGYQSKKAAAQDKTIDEVTWADHEPDGRRAADRNSYLHTTTGEHMKVHHLKDWNATAMLTHAIERIPSEQSCIVLFYEDGELKFLSSNVDNQHAVWMYEMAKLTVLHECITH